MAQAQSLKDELCSVISFSLSKGHQISSVDLFHCHVITAALPDKIILGKDDFTLQSSDGANVYQGMLCHAHEYDGKRSSKIDNFNIIKIPSEKPEYMAIDYGYKYPSNLGATLAFFPEGDRACESLKTYKIITCNDKTYCSKLF